MTTITARHNAKAKQQKKPASVVGSASQGKRTQPRAVHSKTITKTTDNKGRVALGGRFANRAVIVEELSETEMVIKLARVIPESEAWLYDNAEALAAVRIGLSQARAGNITQGPDMDADAQFAAKLED